MRRLRAQAQESGGVAYTAVEAARAANLYQRLGDDKLAEVSHRFYERVYASDTPTWFRSIFANTTRDQAIANQVDFFKQEFGGPRAYEARKGATMILGRHAPYAIDERAARYWLTCMNGALDDAGIQHGCEERKLLDGYLTHMAWFVVHGRQLVNTRRTVGYYGRHQEGDV